MRRSRGFSLLELLICVAIIAILMSMYMGVLKKAKDKADRVVTTEAMRQDKMGRMADNTGTSTGNRTLIPSSTDQLRISREDCRKSYRRFLTTSEGARFVTETRYACRNEDEFQAYWLTLIDAKNTRPVNYRVDGWVEAIDSEGRSYFLPPVTDDLQVPGRGNETVPVQWEFLSRNMGETTMSGIGISVVYSDGHVEYIKYPGEFPATPLVADLSQQFAAQQASS